MNRFSVTVALSALGIATAGLMSGSLAGAASNQNTFSGSCNFHGTATFDKPYLKGQPAPVGYHFKTTAPPSGSTSNNTC